MTPMTNKTQIFSTITAKMNDLYAAKNADYGDSFGQTFEKLGIISAVTRISDKYNRLVSLATKPETDIKVKDEKIEDTLTDMACYCIMTLIELQLSNQQNHDDNVMADEVEVPDITVPNITPSTDIYDDLSTDYLKVIGDKPGYLTNLKG